MLVGTYISRNARHPPRPSRLIVLRTFRSVYLFSSYALIITPFGGRVNRCLPVSHLDERTCSTPLTTGSDRCYNNIMKTKRTARSDSNYIIYLARSEGGQEYIGLTRKGTVTVAKAVKERWRKHVSRARHEMRPWVIYEYMRAGGLDMTWTHTILAVIRGRAEAYAEERLMVKARNPELNDQYL